MPVARAAEPPAFHGLVRVPGLRSLHEMCGRPVPAEFSRSGGAPFGRVRIQDGSRLAEAPEEVPASKFAPYWREAIPWLLEAYGRMCAFSCFRIHPAGIPTVDHMVPKSKAWTHAYEWSNYRLAQLRLNAHKADHDTVLDPFEVELGWFAIELVFGQVVPGPATADNPALRARVQATIDQLRLNDLAGERLRDIQAYEDGDVTLRWLSQESPFVASELARQGRLRPPDLTAPAPPAAPPASAGPASR